MPRNPKSSSKPERRFQFIDNSDVASAGQSFTEVRRHVTQEYMRERRWESRSRAENDVLESGSENRPQMQLYRSSGTEAQPQHSRQIHQEEVNPARASSLQVASSRPDIRLPSVDCKSQASQISAASSALTVPWQQPVSNNRMKRPAPAKRKFHLNARSFAVLAESYALEPPSPAPTIQSGSSWSPPPGSLKDGKASALSLLGAARVDPFDVLPIQLTAKDQELFDFYAVVMPSCSYGFERRHHKAHNWYRDVFIPEAMKGPVTFQNTILVHAANTQAWVRGLNESTLALEYRQRAIGALKDHYHQYPTDTSDEIITATMSAAALEDFDPRLERKPYAWRHWKAAMHKIRQSGGPAMLETKPSLRKLINWQDCIFSGYDGLGSTLYFTPEADFTSLDDRANAEYDRHEILRHCEEFMTFLKYTERIASMAALQLQNPLARHRRQLRYLIFGQGQPLYTLLASPNRDRYTSTGQLKQIISRLGSLMTINVALWEYRHDTTFSETFFQELVDNIMYYELDKNISVEALMQILLSGSNNPALRDSERPWLVGRLLKIAKRLSRDNWEILKHFLLSCLTLDGTPQVFMQP